MTEDGLFSRWSRKKHAARQGREDAAEERATEERATEPAAPADDGKAEADELAALPEDAALERLGLPDPDTLGPGDDFSGFMAKAVPEALRRRALRRLWLSNPVLANIDNLVDYGENFADPALVPEVLATAYRVGSGMLRQDLPPRTEAAAPAPDAAEAPEPEAAKALEPETQDTEPSEAHLATPEPEAEPAPPPDAADGEPPPDPPRRRRMAFTAG